MEPMLGVHEVHLNSLAAPKDIAVDLVAVHGLGGHALETWTHATSRTCWIKHLLHDRLPETRTLVFGYNANRFHHTAELDFLDVARQLISGLVGHRSLDAEKRRPIIFLAHSLGGLIVKKAVTLETDLANHIADCVRAFVFFATPHSGSSLADTAAKIHRVTKLLDVPHNFLRDLCTHSEELQKLTRAFATFLKSREVSCISFYETCKTKRGWLIRDLIVKRESAILGIKDVKELAIPLNADHSNIVRYRSGDDDNFILVLSNLKNLVRGSYSVEPVRREARIFLPFMPRSYFLGRKRELSQLQRWFFPEGQPAHKAIALYGPSGVGKTQLALKYSIDNRDAYDYIFFVNAPSSDVVRNELIKLHTQLKLPEGSGDAVAEMTNWLAAAGERRWLLVFDNANNLKDVVSFITPIALNGHILITCQDARVHGSELVDIALEVEMMSPEESQDLLLTRGAVDESQLDEMEVASALVKELGFLPLAIDSAGAYINVRHKSVSEYSQLFHKYTKEILDHRPEVSSYPVSVLGALEVNFRAIDSQPGASLLLSFLAFLDRTEVTEQFLRRAATPQLRWGSNGEPEEAEPSSSSVPDVFIDLISNDFDFDTAVEVLTSFSIIQCIKREVVGRCFSLHPLTHRCARLRMSVQERQLRAVQTVCVLAHAFPSDEFVLEKGSGILGRSYMPHIYLAYDTFHDTENDLNATSFTNVAREVSRLTVSEQTALMILDANITYGEGDGAKNQHLLAWADELLLGSDKIYLKGRALEVRLAIGFYETGNYVGGAAAVRQFLPEMRSIIVEKGLDQITNAQLGMLEITLAELIVTEVDLDADFEESLALLRGWTPIHPNSPSQKESMALGILSQTLGKILKDKGDFPKSAAELKHYLDTFVVSGSQNEGWATGDYAQVLMEMGHKDQAEENLLALLKKRPTYSNPDEKNRDRRSDVMFIDIQYGECLYLHQRYSEAEAMLLELKVKFQRFGDLWHFEKTRVFFILTALARTAQGTRDFSKALAYWQEALHYATTSVDQGYQKGKWRRDTFLVSVVIYSMADCYYELGDLDQARALRKEAELTQHVHQRMCWMMALGTYWLSEVRKRMSERSGPLH